MTGRTFPRRSWIGSTLAGLAVIGEMEVPTDALESASGDATGNGLIMEVTPIVFDLWHLECIDSNGST